MAEPSVVRVAKESLANIIGPQRHPRASFKKFMENGIWCLFWFWLICGPCFGLVHSSMTFLKPSLICHFHF